MARNSVRRCMMISSPAVVGEGPFGPYFAIEHDPAPGLWQATGGARADAAGSRVGPAAAATKISRVPLAHRAPGIHGVWGDGGTRFGVGRGSSELALRQWCTPLTKKFPYADGAGDAREGAGTMVRLHPSAGKAQGAGQLRGKRLTVPGPVCTKPITASLQEFTDRGPVPPPAPKCAPLRCVAQRSEETAAPWHAACELRD